MKIRELYKDHWDAVLELLKCHVGDDMAVLLISVSQLSK